MIKLYDFDSLKPEEILNRDIRAEKNVKTWWTPSLRTSAPGAMRP